MNDRRFGGWCSRLFRRRGEAHAELQTAVAGEVSGIKRRRSQKAADNSDDALTNARHFAALLVPAIDGLDKSFDLFHLAQAIIVQNALQAIASETDVYPRGRQTTNSAGLKMKATRRYAIVMAPAPVDFWDANNKLLKLCRVN